MPDHRPAAPAVPATTPPKTAALDDPADRLRGRKMAASLGRLLDRVAGARDALPHLAALEQALDQRGAVAVESIPPRWRDRIGAQLGSLPLPADDPPLRDLLQRLRGGAAEPSPPPPAPAPAAARAAPPVPAPAAAPVPADLPPLEFVLPAESEAVVAAPAAVPAPAPAPAPARPAPLSMSALMQGSAIDTESTVVVRELSHSEFMAMADGGPGIGADSRL